jgi:hypothetical protein
MASFGRIPDLGEVTRCVIEEPVFRSPRRALCA